MMLKNLILLLFLIASFLAKAQGYHKSLALHDDPDFIYTQIRHILPQQADQAIVLGANHLYQNDREAYSFSRFNLETGKITKHFVASKGVADFLVNDDLYLQRHGASDFDLRCNWAFVDLNKEEERWLELKHYSLSDPYIKNDSAFIICSKALIDYQNPGLKVDSMRTAYLTYLNSENGSYQFIDSVEYPILQQHGALQYLDKEGSWQITQDSLRFCFKAGRITKSRIDSLLILKPYRWPSVRGQRYLYFRNGRHYTFRDTLGARLYHYWYREQDTLEYALNFSGPFRNIEEFNLQTGFLGSLRPRNDSVMDWMRYLENGSVEMHRFEPNGQHHIQYFNQPDYPHYSIWTMRSMPDGSFYLVGGEKRSIDKMMGIIIKVDANGQHEEILGENRFQIHYNPEQDWLDLFYDELDEKLWYEIWDMSGVRLHQGPVKSFEALKLFRGSKGLHVVKLYSFDRSVYYGRRTFVRY